MSHEETLKEIGKRLSPTQKRDAFHIAVCPVLATEHFLPGEHVGIKDGKAVKNRGQTELVGIIDPFLAHCIVGGEYIFVFLYPGTITSLRHEWTHPVIDKDKETERMTMPESTKISHEDHKVKSQAWIEEHATELGMSTQDLLYAANDWLENEQHTVQQGSEWWRDHFDSTNFWHHYEIMTGKTIPEDKRGHFFCCHC